METKGNKKKTHSQCKRALIVSLCVPYWLPVAVAPLPVVAIACEFIKINIIIFSTNCFSLQHIYSLLVSFSRSFSPFVLFISLALIFHIAFGVGCRHQVSRSFIEMAKGAHTLTEPIQKWYKPKAWIETVRDRARGKRKNERQPENFLRHYNWILHLDNCMHIVCGQVLLFLLVSASFLYMLHPCRLFSVSEFDPENVIKITIWFLFNGLNTNYTTRSRFLSVVCGCVFSVCTYSNGRMTEKFTGCERTERDRELKSLFFFISLRLNTTKHN